MLEVGHPSARTICVQQSRRVFTPCVYVRFVDLPSRQLALGESRTATCMITLLAEPHIGLATSDMIGSATTARPKVSFEIL